MRIQILSDLHLDAGGLHVPALAPGADLLVVAGDVCAGTAKGMRLLRERVPRPTPIVMVLGNHEFYGLGHATELASARVAAKECDITLLENEAAWIGGIRFVGATLWTDYALFGRDMQDDCMQVARAGLNDHRLIGLLGSGGPRFLPSDAEACHRSSRNFIETSLKHAVPGGPTVVVTHHAPHEKSVAPRFRNSLLTAAFVSDLSEVIEAYRPALWVHGHTHTSFDYRVGATRVVCNPAGYGAENPSFDPALVVEVS
jgi:Icc-related predicted phosphoesterase